MARDLTIGRLTEPVTFVSTTPPAIPVTILTSAGTVATAVTGTPHGFRSGEYVTIRGAVPLGYNGDSRQVTVITDDQFSYDVPAGLASPATGSITVTFKSDSQGGGGDAEFIVGQAFAFITPLNAAERLALSGGPAATVNYRAIVHYRPGLAATMKLRWRRYQETADTDLEIFGVYPHPEPTYARRFLVIECGELA